MSFNVVMILGLTVLFAIAVGGIVGSVFLAMPLCRILEKAWESTKSDEMRVLSWTSMQRFLFFLRWKQKKNYLFLFLMFLLFCSPSAWHFEEMRPGFSFSRLLNILIIYVVFLFITLGSGLFCLTVNRGKNSYTAKTTILMMVLSPMIAIPKVFGLIVTGTGGSFSPLQETLLLISPVFLSVVAFGVGAAFFIFRLGSVDIHLAEGNGVGS